MGTALFLDPEPRGAHLSESEALLRALTEVSVDAVLVMDSDGRFRYTNPAHERLTGYSATEIVGQKFAELIHPDDRLVAANRFAERCEWSHRTARQVLMRKSMSSLPLTYHTDVLPALRAAIEDIVGEHQTLERVLDWCQGQHPPRWIEAIVAQDEFSSDVIVLFDQQHYLVYDTT
jgi:PAS domain S-box-containing protein